VRAFGLCAVKKGLIKHAMSKLIINSALESEKVSLSEESLFSTQDLRDISSEEFIFPTEVSSLYSDVGSVSSSDSDDEKPLEPPAPSLLQRLKGVHLSNYLPSLNLNHCHKIDEETKTIISDAQHSIDSIRDSLTSIIGLMSPKNEGDNAFLLSVVSKISSFLVGVVACVRIKDLEARIYILTLTYLGVGIDTTYKVITKLASALQPPTVVAQAGSSNLLENFVFVISSIFGKNTKEDLDKVNSYTRNFHNMSTFSKDCKDGFGYVISLFTQAISIFHSLSTGVPLSFRNLGPLYHKVGAFSSEIFAENIKTDVAVKLGTDFLLRDYVQRQVMLRNSIDKELIAMSITPGSIAPYVRACKILDGWDLILRNICRTDVSRPKPIVIYLHGDPGVGKTCLSYIIAASLKRHFKMETVKSMIYSRKMGIKFWDGYVGQPICVLDEMFQIDSSKEAAESVLEFLQMANDASMPMNMSSVEEKGTKFFVSNVIIITSNTPPICDTRLLGVRHPSAFLRRIDYNIKVSVKQEYFGNNGHGVGVVSDLGLNSDVYELKQSFLNDEMKKFENIKDISFDEFLASIKTELNVRARDENSLVNAVDNMYPYIKPSYGKEEKLTVGENLKSAFTEFKKDVMPEAQMLKKVFDMLPFGSYNHISVKALGLLDRFSDRELLNILTSCDVSPKKIDHDYLVSECHRLFREYVQEKRQSTGWYVSTRQLEKEALLDFFIMYSGKKVSGNFDTTRTILELPRYRFLGFLYDAFKLVLAGIGIYTVFTYMKSDKKENTKPEVRFYEPDISMVKHPKIPSDPKRVRGWSKVNLPGAQTAMEAVDLAHSKVGDNLVLIEFVMHGGQTYVMNGIFTHSRSLLTAGHILAPLADSSVAKIRILEFSSRNSIYEFSPSEIKFNQSDGDDLVRLTFPLKLHEFSDIRHLFIKEDNLRSDLTSSALLSVRDRKGKSLCLSSSVVRYANNVQYTLGDQLIGTERALRMKIDTEQGYCGGLYIATNSKLVHKLLGIHVAGGTGIAYCCIITQEMLADMPEGQVLALVNCFGDEKPSFDVPDGVRVVGVVQNDLALRMPINSDFVRSPLRGVLVEPNTFPSLLKKTKQADGSYLSPLSLAVKKYSKPDVECPNPEILYDVVEFLKHDEPMTVPVKMCDLYEALNVPPSYEYTKKVHIDTSPGWPYNVVKRKKPGKGDYIVRDVLDNNLPTPSLVKLVNERIDGYLGLGERVPTVYADFLKDELVSQNSIDVGKTRVVSSAPIDLLVLSRMFFQDFVENTMMNHGTSECALGINPHSSEWKMLYKKLLEVRSPARVIAGDCRGYDGSQSSDLRLAIDSIVMARYEYDDPVTFICKYLGREFTKLQRHRIRMCILEDDRSLLHIICNVIIEAFVGRASGSHMTTVGNSLGIKIIVFYAIASHLRQREGFYNLSLIKTAIALSTFGDDHVLALARLLDTFNMGHMKIYAAHFGVDYTDFKKRPLIITDIDGVISCNIDSYSINEVTYLKRSFVSRNNIVYAPLALSLIDNTLNYVRKGDSLISNIHATFRSCLLEWFHYGKEIYDIRMTKVNLALRDLGYNEIWIPYDYWYAQLLGVVKAQMMKDTEREADLAVVDTKQQLTSFSDTDSLQSTNLASTVSSLIKNSDPYPDQGLGTVLSRVYQVAAVTWAGSSIIGTNIASLDVGTLLMNVPSINTRLNKFKFLRGAIRVQIRVNSTMFHYGKLAVCWVPHFNTLNSSFILAETNMLAWINNEMIIVSAATQDTVEFTIPFCSPTLYFDLENLNVSGYAGWFGLINVFVLHPLNLCNSTATPTVSCLVYANFVNPEVAGLSYSTLPTAQMLKEQEEKSERGVISGIFEAATVLSDSIKTLPIVGSIATSLKPTFKKIWQTTKNLGLDKPTSVMAANSVVLRPSSSLCLTRGLDNCEKLAMDPSNALSTNSDFCSLRQVDSILDYAKLPGYVNNFSFDATNTAGQAILAMPVGPTYSVNYTPSTGVYYYPLTPMGHASSFFRYWRGSMKFYFIITCPKVVSARIQVEWHPSLSVPVIGVSQMGDFVTTVVDVNGDNQFGVTVPYLNNRLYGVVALPSNADLTNITEPEANGTLIFRLINPPVAFDSTAATTIYVAVFMAAGEDFELSRPCELWTGFTDLNVAKAQVGVVNSIRDIFTVPFPPISDSKYIMLDRVCNGEKIGTWSELFHRYSTIDIGLSTNVSTYVTINPWNISGYSLTAQFRRFLKTFLYYRGSMRIKIIPVNIVSGASTNSELFGIGANTIVSGIYTPSNGNQGFFDGAAYVDTTTKGVLEVEIPFYSNNPMVCFMYNTEKSELGAVTFNYIAKTSSGAVSYSYIPLVSTGDDFTCGWALAPPILSGPAPTKKRVTPVVTTDDFEIIPLAKAQCARIPSDDLRQEPELIVPPVEQVIRTRMTLIRAMDFGSDSDEDEVEYALYEEDDDGVPQLLPAAQMAAFFPQKTMYEKLHDCVLIWLLFLVLHISSFSQKYLPVKYLPTSGLFYLNLCLFAVSYTVTLYLLSV